MPLVEGTEASRDVEGGGAYVYRGFAPGVGPEDFRNALDAMRPDKVAECLGKVEVRPGDVIDLPAGTVHAIGKGLLL